MNILKRIYHWLIFIFVYQKYPYNKGYEYGSYLVNQTNNVTSIDFTFNNKTRPVFSKPSFKTYLFPFIVDIGDMDENQYAEYQILYKTDELNNMKKCLSYQNMWNKNSWCYRNKEYLTELIAEKELQIKQLKSNKN